MFRAIGLVMSCVLLAGAWTPAAAAPKPAEEAHYAPVTDLAPFQAMLATCAKRFEGAAPSYGDVVRVEQIGVEDGVPLYHAHMAKKGRRAIFRGTTVPADGPCPIYFVGQASAGGYGDYLGDGRRLRAFVIPEYDGICASKACTAAVIVRDAKKAFYRVGTTGTLVCEQPTARTVKVFAGQDSLELTCNTPLGAADYRQQLLLFHATSAAFAPLLSVSKGAHTGEVGESDAGGQELCERDGAGFIKVVKAGEAPVLELFEPSDDPGEDDGPHGTLTRATWDAAKGRFVKGEAHPHTLPTWPKETCTPME